MRKKELKIFLGFMKSQWAAWVILCLSAVIFFLLDKLGLTSSPYTVYGIFLLTFLTFVIMFINYVKYRARALTLLKAFEHMSLDVSDLPNPGDFEGECYTAIIDALHRKMAEAVHRLDENYTDQIDYYSMWVHQIKTPIAALRLMVQSELSLSNKLAWQTEIFKIEQYVAMVLMYLRLTNLAQDMVLETVDVRAVVSACVKKYSTMFIYKKLSVDISEFNMQAASDAKWLAVIVEQFLSNSLKYTERGSIHIYCEQTKKVQALVIEDEGIGIRSEDIPRIFDKGYTGCNGRAYEKSTGIGLYIAKKTADYLGIRFEVSSSVGVGTKVRIVLPKPQK